MSNYLSLLRKKVTHISVRHSKLFKQVNTIVSMKLFKKPNCNLCMEERLIIFKNLHDKDVTLMNNDSEIYRAFRHKKKPKFYLITNDPVIKLNVGCTSDSNYVDLKSLMVTFSTMYFPSCLKIFEY